MNDVYDILTQELYEKFKTAVEIGKWPDGKPLTTKQKQTCFEAIITYEHKHVKAENRTGYVPKKASDCASKEENVESINWINKK